MNMEYPRNTLIRRTFITKSLDHFDGLMVSMPVSSAVDHGFMLWLGQTKDCKLGISSKSKEWLAQNHNNVSKWSDISTRGLLLQ